MKIYIAGKITGLENYKEKFAEAEKRLKAQGHTVINPAALPEGFEHDEYLHICFAMIDVCDAVYLLDNWRDSPGAVDEYFYASKNEKKMFYQGESRKRGVIMICKGCMAVQGDRHPLDVTDFTNAKCALGYKTMIDRGMMMPVNKCPKPKSHKAVNRLLKEASDGKK